MNNILEILENRFKNNIKRHEGISWDEVLKRLMENEDKLEILKKMEASGGEPDVIGKVEKGHFIFCDCAKETPNERRSLCYDREALDSRKEHKPVNSVIDMAQDIGIELLTEVEYRELQKLGPFDQKTSSWLKTPVEIRSLGGAIFGDYRYGRVFIYHNGAESYYGSRGFRGLLKV